MLLKSHPEVNIEEPITTHLQNLISFNKYLRAMAYKAEKAKDKKQLTESHDRVKEECKDLVNFLLES